MIHDSERREVARRLREQAKKLGPNMDAHEFAHYTADVIDVNECMTWHEMTLLLADLIEPTCDHEALLALADILGSTRETDCMGCRLEGAGCADCSSGVAHEAALRIRKALGVE